MWKDTLILPDKVGNAEITVEKFLLVLIKRGILKAINEKSDTQHTSSIVSGMSLY